MADIQELRRQVLMKRLQQKRDSAQSSESVPGADFAKSMAMGSAIGEHMPGGKTIADLGTKIGSGIVAATSAPFSDQSMGDIYDQSMAASQKAEQERASLDAKSPMASGVKEIMGQVPLMAMKTPAARPIAETPAAPGKFNYPPDSRTEKIREYLAQKIPQGSKLDFVKEMGEAMLPNSVQMAIKAGRYLKK